MVKEKGGFPVVPAVTTTCVRRFDSLACFRQMIRSQLLREDLFEQDWTISGLGYLRWDIGRFRMHIWHNEFVSDPLPTQIHDHPWDFTSFCVAGQLRNIAYKWHDDPAHGEYKKQGIICGEDARLVGQPVRGSIGMYLSQNISAGQQYNLDQGQFHQTEFKNGTITLVDRLSTGMSENRANAVYYAGHPEQVFSPENEPRFVTAAPRMANNTEICIGQNAALRYLM